MEEETKCKYCGGEMKWIAGGKDISEFNTDYMKSRCGNCSAEYTTKKIWTTGVSRAKSRNVKDRNQEEHLLLIKEVHGGSVRKYLLSMGAFKDVQI